jgi:hypothetical protein
LHGLPGPYFIDIGIGIVRHGDDSDLGSHLTRVLAVLIIEPVGWNFIQRKDRGASGKGSYRVSDLLPMSSVLDARHTIHEVRWRPASAGILGELAIYEIPEIVVYEHIDSPTECLVQVSRKR